MFVYSVLLLVVGSVSRCLSVVVGMMFVVLSVLLFFSICFVMFSVYVLLDIWLCVLIVNVVVCGLIMSWNSFVCCGWNIIGVWILMFLSVVFGVLKKVCVVVSVIFM